MMQYGLLIRRMRSVSVIVALFGFLTVAGAAPTAQLQPKIEALDQTVVNGTITVQRVVAARQGKIVIYPDQNGKPVMEKSLGQREVQEGENTNVNVPVEMLSVPKIWVVLETSENTPVQDAAGNIVMKQINITGRIPAQLPNTSGSGTPVILIVIALLLLLGGTFLLWHGQPAMTEKAYTTNNERLDS